MNVDILKDTISDIVTDLLFYDRKEDKELPAGAIEEAIKNGVISIDYIVDIFRKEVEKNLKDKK